MHALVYIVFVKLYEEKREKPGVHSRFTTAGFERYRQSLPRRVRTDYKDRHLTTSFKRSRLMRRSKRLES